MAKGELYNQAEMRRLWGIGGMGLELAGSIVILALIGWAVDRWAGTSPAWTLVGAGIGFIGGGYNFLRRARSMSRANARSRPRGPLSSPSQPVAKGPDEFERLLAEEKARSKRGADE
jgi:hypothetical protein